MRKLIIAIGAVAALGVGYWLISPLFITRRVEEKLEDIMAVIPPAPPSPQASTSAEASADKSEGTASALEIVVQGTFTGLAGHRGQGTAKLLKAGGKHFVRFEDDFRVTNGPDLFVYFGKDGEYAAEARIAALKGNEGSQNYEVPAGIDPTGYDEVWVWCRTFSVPFAKAELR